MLQSFSASILCVVFATNLLASPPQFQDLAKATCLLQHLQHREMKSDEKERVWYLDISEQDAVSDKTLVAIRHLPHLREVYMIFCPIRGDGLVHLAGLKHIEKLDLCATRIDDNAIRHIANLTTLKYLDIRATGVTIKGVATNDHGAISDDGIKLVANNLPNLESLLCCGTITDDGLRHLVKLKELRYLEITSPNVTPGGLRWLKNAMPRLEIDD